MDITANVLLAVGAAPAMVCCEEETPAFLPRVDALYVNMGTLNAMRVREVTVAIAEATRLKKPWVLDPVACGGTAYRTENCVKAMKQRPTIVRGNGSEIIALASAACTSPPASAGTAPRGPDSTANSICALHAAEALAIEFGSVVVISGAWDVITDGKNPPITVGGGSELLTKITGAGCALSALVAAFVGACPQLPVEAAVAACATMSTAAQASNALDPGNLRVHLIARLHTMTPTELGESALVGCLHDAVAAVAAVALESSRAPATLPTLSPPPHPAPLSLQLLDEKTKAQQHEVLFDPLMLHVALDTCPPDAVALLRHAFSSYCRF
jgi:hydroxyethylthiazole kinase